MRRVNTPWVSSVIYLVLALAVFILLLLYITTKNQAESELSKIKGQLRTKQKLTEEKEQKYKDQLEKKTLELTIANAKLQETQLFLTTQQKRLTNVIENYLEGRSLSSTMEVSTPTGQVNEIVDLYHLSLLTSNIQTAKEQVYLKINGSEEADQQLYKFLYKILDKSMANPIIRRFSEEDSKRLTKQIQRVIEFHQNPENCSNTRQLICKLDKDCGFGCQFHHVYFCFTTALASNRTLVLNTDNWRYQPNGGWDAILQPVSTCKYPIMDPNVKIGDWRNADDANDRVLTIPIVESVRSPPPPNLPPHSPFDVEQRVRRWHGRPDIWWTGQLITYLMRPSDALKKTMEEEKNSWRWAHPIVGVHVRRTDKIGTEANRYEVSQYMDAVNRYFESLITQGTIKPDHERVVFLASDEKAVLDEARNNYKNYRFIVNEKSAEVAGTSTRYSDASLKGIFTDVHHLSDTDYLVCTFSSQVCRLAFEIMQTKHLDASKYFHSLDWFYYYGGNLARTICPIAEYHGGSGEMDLRFGDVLEEQEAVNKEGWRKGRRVSDGTQLNYPGFLTSFCQTEEHYRNILSDIPEE